MIKQLNFGIKKNNKFENIKILKNVHEKSIFKIILISSKSFFLVLLMTQLNYGKNLMIYINVIL